jgi:hypothetical protein
MQDRKITTLSMETEHPPCDSADARTLSVSRRTAGIGGRHAPLRNAGISGNDRGRLQRPSIAHCVEVPGRSTALSPQPTGPGASRAAATHDGGHGRVGSPRGPRNHDGTIIPETVDTMWGTDLTTTFTGEGPAAVFVAMDHCAAKGGEYQL